MKKRGVTHTPMRCSRRKALTNSVAGFPWLIRRTPC
jgi:hypothetical protein